MKKAHNFPNSLENSIVPIVVSGHVLTHIANQTISMAHFFLNQFVWLYGLYL